MVQFFSQSCYYNHHWSLVSLGVWRKYPNPQSAHVISVDVLDRSIDPKSGIIRTERVIGCKQKAPRWVVKILGGSSDAFVREVSHLNPHTGETHLTSENLSLCQYLSVLERVHYTPCSSSTSNSTSTASTSTSTDLQVVPSPRTLFTQTAEIHAKIGAWKPIQERFELWSLDMFGKNAQKGREGFEHVLRALWESRQGLITDRSS